MARDVERGRGVRGSGRISIGKFPKDSDDYCIETREEKPRRFRCYSEVTAMSAGSNTLGSAKRGNDAIKSVPPTVLVLAA